MVSLDAKLFEKKFTKRLANRIRSKLGKNELITIRGVRRQNKMIATRTDHARNDRVRRTPVENRNSINNDKICG